MIGFSNVMKALINYDKPITLHNNITKITIPSNSYNNDMSHLNMRGFPALEELIIGSNCFGGVNSLILNEMNGIESIVIGESSLFNTSSIMMVDLPLLDHVEMREDALYGGGSNSSLMLVNLPSLRNISSIGNSFVELRNLIATSSL